MEIGKTDSTAQNNDTIVVHGSGSVAHQIIGEFLAALNGVDGYTDIAKNLKTAIFDEKPTEAALRIAMFGEDSI